MNIELKSSDYDVLLKDRRVRWFSNTHCRYDNYFTPLSNEDIRINDDVSIPVIIDDLNYKYMNRQQKIDTLTNMRKRFNKTFI